MGAESRHRETDLDEVRLFGCLLQMKELVSLLLLTTHPQSMQALVTPVLHQTVVFKHTANFHGRVDHKPDLDHSA